MVDDETGPDVRDLVALLDAQDVVGVTLGWVDNNGIVRARTVPLAELPAVARRGVGATTAVSVFDSHDGITFAHDGLSTPAGDLRLIPVVDGPRSIVPLAGQPGFAWVPARLRTADGDPWPYEPRDVLERQVRRAAEAGFEVRAGFEIEMYVARDDDGATAAHRGPAYSANALRDVDEFARQLLVDLAANGLSIGQLHAEYGAAQLEIALSPLDALAACDAQVLARQTIHAAARRHGLRVSFAPVATVEGVGNGWHLHTSLTRDGANALTGDGPHGLSDVGRGYLAGLLRELPGLVGVTAPSTGSLVRRRPGYWAGAYGFWGVENREAVLRLVPSSDLLGAGHTNVELKASDASANPYLALAVVIAAGLRGIADGAEPPEPIQEDVGTWDAERLDAAGIALLATTHEEQRAHLLASDLVRGVLGEELLGAFVAVRDADAAWALDHTPEEIVESLRWLY
ncbi:glutamine synthetase [Nocardioides sp. KIGAM211]|uniref:Glutamine synthetase n=1 Tax=Nocardioides luti TaxID=2761101 RepID=A0A7X0RGQ1_9ACTN|nr:glutamine synthetase family protein [Nocardioides luti]MBB6628008.1 glutamine synthetase [Nocardioides luti]